MAKAVKDVRRRSENYYFNAREKIHNQLALMPVGTIKKRLISGHTYYYLQHREAKKVIHKYIGKEIPKELKKQMQQREVLRRQLDKVQEILRGFWIEKIGRIGKWS